MTLGLGGHCIAEMWPVAHATHSCQLQHKLSTLWGLMFHVDKTMPVSDERRFEEGP